MENNTPTIGTIADHAIIQPRDNEAIADANDFLCGPGEAGVLEAWRELPESERESFVAGLVTEASTDWGIPLQPKIVAFVLDSRL